MKVYVEREEGDAKGVTGELLIVIKPVIKALGITLYLVASRPFDYELAFDFDKVKLVTKKV